ncbi:MAG TPA: ABC transporter permease subunit [Thermoanaerobaculia bacterium]|nr:ABC transporter permease subunit [Thermoanaerobaculia bacterium]
MSGLSAPVRSLRDDGRGFASSVPETRSGDVVATVFRHEVGLAARSFRFWAAAFLLLALMLLGAVTSAARHRRDATGQADIEQAYARRLAGATVADAAEISHPALKPPWRLALVVDGGQAATPDTLSQPLSALEEPALRRAAEENPRLPAGEPLDWLFGIRIVLSIGAFLLCHGAVCGEQRGGTLKLLFSLPISHWKILAGKFLAAWTCLAVPFLAGAVVSLLIAASLGDLQLTGENLLRAALGALAGLWAAAFFVLLALLVSSLTRDPSSSLGVLALLWVAAVVVVPALSVLLARRLQPLPTDAEINQQMAAARLTAGREFAGEGERWRQPRWAVVDGYAWEKLSARVEIRRAALQEEIRRQLLGGKMRQAFLARTLASLSPPSLVQDIAERLTGTGLARDQAFLDQAWAFRAALEERVRRLDAADPASPHILFFREYMSPRPLGPDPLPRFAFREQTLGEGVSSAQLVILAFALETLLLAASALLAFTRYNAG